MGVSGRRLTAVEVGELHKALQRRLSLRQAARELGLSKRTVQKYAALLKSSPHIGQR